MRLNLRATALVSVLTAATLASAALATSGATAAAARPSSSATSAMPHHAARLGVSLGTLTVSPAVHVAGQALTFQGALPQAGKRTIHLQFHMNRPGDKWRDVEKSNSSTTAAGTFKFTFPAPAMFDISYRVVGGDLVTKPYLFYARPQAVTLSVNGEDEKAPYVTVPILSTFTIVVDSAADIYTGRDLKPPVLAGRVITLQERVSGNQWRDVGTGRADANGLARFELAAGLLGEKVYRARAEDFYAKGNRIGWTASWPTYVGFTLLGIPLRPRGSGADSVPGRTPPVTDSTGATDASTQYGWYRPTYDFAWEYGQSLSSPPTRGEVLKGRWEDASSGSGRVVLFNGALAFQSKLNHKGPGDRGTTSATLVGNAQKFGRWEFRVWQNIFEKDGRNFRMRVELVPEGTAASACSPEAIRVADMELGQSSYSVGVRSAKANAQWSYTKTSTPAYSGLHNFAVEVAGDHITWFFDGKAFATVKDKKAISGKTLVARVSMVGSEDATEYNGSQFSVDWVRSWTLETGKQASVGRAPTKGAFSPTC